MTKGLKNKDEPQSFKKPLLTMEQQGKKMKHIKKMVALATLLAMAGTATSNLSAQQYYSDSSGCCDPCGQGYEDCCQTCWTPYIAIGAVAVIAIVAVACRHHGGSSSHGH